ncbi:hypothetical protein L226DRAFT_574800 [Lentinus tigrinus ALCF2SS1-7]|uniref:uncharacterized protein n=1 Tax=Lentinus tigrinus ALCF2SS1-7 TaxID=1328758 RepID=UPI001166195E|nr:hypothetical protein L226DRAFT_574800 [Lentinus tigrinus ALCF2SS1-7]
MATPLAPQHYDIFMSIFKGYRNARFEFSENDLAKAMVAAGFSFTDIKRGSRRQFTPQGSAREKFGNASYTFHLHGALITKHRQDLLSSDLAGLFTMSADSFVLRKVKVAEPAEPVEPVEPLEPLEALEPVQPQN